MSVCVCVGVAWIGLMCHDRLPIRVSTKRSDIMDNDIHPITPYCMDSLCSLQSCYFKPIFLHFIYVFLNHVCNNHLTFYLLFYLFSQVTSSINATITHIFSSFVQLTHVSCLCFCCVYNENIMCDSCENKLLSRIARNRYVFHMHPVV